MTTTEKNALNDYQRQALTTARDNIRSNINYLALGLNGEAGEVADKVKKIIRDDHGEMTDDKRREIALEVGDVLWYVAVLSNHLGYTLEEVAKMNTEKLRSRQQRGKIGGSGDNR